MTAAAPVISEILWKVCLICIETINKQIGGVGNNIRAIRKGKLKAEVVQDDE